MVVVDDGVAVVVVVFVGAYSPVTGNHARQLHGSTPRGDVGPRNPVVAYSGSPFCCSRHGGRRKSAVLGDALPPLGVDAPLDKDSPSSPGKGSAGAIRVARLLLTLSSDVKATDDEATRAFSIGSSLFAIPNV